MLRKLIESTLVSLDGVVESPNRCTPVDDESAAFAMEQLDDYDAFVMGRVTYERLSANEGVPTRNLELAEARTLGTGVVILVYRPL